MHYERVAEGEREKASDRETARERERARDTWMDKRRKDVVKACSDPTDHLTWQLGTRTFLYNTKTLSAQTKQIAPRPKDLHHVAAVSIVA